MIRVGQPECAAQNRVLRLFREEGYTYRGDWSRDYEAVVVADEILRQLHSSQCPIVITQNGRPVAS